MYFNEGASQNESLGLDRNKNRIPRKSEIDFELFVSPRSRLMKDGHKNNSGLPDA